MGIVYMNTGSFNKLHDDCCAVRRQLKDSVGPCEYRLYFGAYENSNKCVHDKFYRKFDLVDQESELKNINRRASRCPGKKYNPSCKKSKYCTSTFDKSNPIVLAPEICSIVDNNLKKQADRLISDMRR